jgi:hypothetical protein
MRCLRAGGKSPPAWLAARPVHRAPPSLQASIRNLPHREDGHSGFGLRAACVNPRRRPRSPDRQRMPRGRRKSISFCRDLRKGECPISLAYRTQRQPSAQALGRATGARGMRLPINPNFSARGVGNAVMSNVIEPTAPEPITLNGKVRSYRPTRLGWKAAINRDVSAALAVAIGWYHARVAPPPLPTCCFRELWRGALVVRDRGDGEADETSGPQKLDRDRFPRHFRGQKSMQVIDAAERLVINPQQEVSRVAPPPARPGHLPLRATPLRRCAPDGADVAPCADRA